MMQARYRAAHAAGAVGMGDIAVAETFGAGWLLMLVFAVGGFAGMVLAALMVMAGAQSAGEEQRDFGD